MDPDGLRSWLYEAAANPLLVLLVFVVIRVLIYQHRQNLERFSDLSKRMDDQVKATHDVAVALRANGDRIVAAIERTAERVRERYPRHPDDTR